MEAQKWLLGDMNTHSRDEEWWGLVHHTWENRAEEEDEGTKMMYGWGRFEGS